MPFSHHSHSGQFCPGHAQDSLEDVIKNAIGKGFKVFALSEHMPRDEIDFYPEEIESGTTLLSALENESNYVMEAQRLRQKYGSQISLPIGFETDWCGPHSLKLIEASIQKHPYDFFMGSIHHVRGVPIDYDQERYDRAKEAAGGTDEKLFEEYFDEQLEMLKAIRPPVVGHLDLIRLKSKDINVSWTQSPGVWDRILRNLDYIVSYGGILEINTAALRKGMDEPYPNSEICQAFLTRGGRFCLSDDSHGVAHLATNYHRLLPFLQHNQITSLAFLTHESPAGNHKDPRFPTLSVHTIKVDEIKSHPTLSGVQST